MFFRYSAVTPDVPRALHPDEAIAHLREHVYYHAHNHAFYKARCAALEARLAALTGA
ncbi:hypothetical protein D9M72_460390 [compost metagenome]